MTPKLSIVVPFFNRARYLRTSLLSILAGGEEGWEIVAVDDGSTDGGAKGIADLPVKIITSRVNGGPGHARNLGLSVARSDLIYFFDSDDELISDSLKWLVTQIESNPSFVAVGGRFAEVIDRDGKNLKGPEVEQYCRSPRPDRLTFDFFARGPGFAGGLPLFIFRRSILDRVGPLDESMKCAEDREFLLRLLRMADIPLFDCPMLKRRVHDSNLAVRINSEGKFELKGTVKAMNLLLDLAQT